MIRIIYNFSLISVIGLNLSISAAQFTILNNSSYDIEIKASSGSTSSLSVSSNSVIGPINTSSANCANDQIILHSLDFVPKTPNYQSRYANSKGKMTWTVNISCYGGINKNFSVQDAINGFYVVEY